VHIPTALEEEDSEDGTPEERAFAIAALGFDPDVEARKMQDEAEDGDDEAPPTPAVPA